MAPGFLNARAGEDFFDRMTEWSEGRGEGRGARMEDGGWRMEVNPPRLCPLPPGSARGRNQVRADRLPAHWWRSDVPKPPTCESAVRVRNAFHLIALAGVNRPVQRAWTITIVNFRGHVLTGATRHCPARCLFKTRAI